MGGARHSAQRIAFTAKPKLLQAIIETERLLEDGKPASYLLLGDDVQLEYYKDGYPKLLSSLDRRQVVDFAQAA